MAYPSKPKTKPTIPTPANATLELHTATVEAFTEHFAESAGIDSDMSEHEALAQPHGNIL